MGHYAELLNELHEPTRSLRHAIPETWAGFVSTHQAAMADGAVPSRLKEAAALAISVVTRCEPCIAHHAKAAARAGAAPEEVAELLGVALLMEGGPASAYAPMAWAAYQEFAAAGAPLATAGA